MILIEKRGRNYEDGSRSTAETEISFQENSRWLDEHNLKKIV